MFRIEYLKLSKHPQLGDIELTFSDNSEYETQEYPYTSVIIGSNGTGKSYILRTIAEIFRQFQEYSETDKKEFSLSYNIHLRYRYYQNTYEIVTRRLQFLANKGMRKEYLFFKNRPSEAPLKENSQFGERTGFEVPHQELEYPTKLLVTSVMNNDRFVFKRSNTADFYQYLGARSTNSTASTKSSVKRTIKHIFNATASSELFSLRLKDLLSFLEFEESFKVIYKTKINKLFFSQDLTKENFKKYFEYWWDEDFKFSKRKQDNPLWSIPYYNIHFKNNEGLTESIIKFLNQLPLNQNRFKEKEHSRSKIIELDLFDGEISKTDLTLISHLENLDILNLEGIQIVKNNKELSISQISSGEYHLLLSLIGIFANISDESLILIDEPEISLHPNWQMRYISFLKNVFSKFNSCHFILTTHSHFLVSDMEDKSSYLLGLKRDANIISTVDVDANTFGWSAEEVLYKIFNVKSTRNSYLEYDLIKMVNIINRDTKEYDILRAIIDKIQMLNISEGDPLNILKEKATLYLNKNA